MPILNYFTEVKGQIFQCSQCKWTGPSEKAATELFAELFELNCPHCDARLALVPLPTREDVQAAADAGDSEAQSMLKAKSQ